MPSVNPERPLKTRRMRWATNSNQGPWDLDVPAVGSVVRGGTTLPWRLVDEAGAEVEHVNLWLTELCACDCSPATLRAYAYDLLSWIRFLAAIGTQWTRVNSWDVRDWVRWYRFRENPQRRRGTSSAHQRPSPGAVNERTGKP
jgi:integrase/recombinase XerC